jgi:peptidoglycan/LPS O-acetylase OafA/YrhL
MPDLDLLRAAAISWVMIYHASLFNLVLQQSWVVCFGWMGVDLFFVLSGFLIPGQPLRPWARGERPDLSRFFTRRLRQNRGLSGTTVDITRFPRLLSIANRIA